MEEVKSLAVKVEVDSTELEKLKQTLEDIQAMLDVIEAKAKEF